MTNIAQNQAADQHAADKAARPVRRNYYMTVVLGPNGSIIDEAKWKGIVGDKTGREMAKALRKEKMTVTRVFQADKWNEARTNFRQSQKQTRIDARSALIDEAFASANQAKSKRVENALRTLLPLFKDADTGKTAKAFKDIIGAVVHAAGDLANLEQAAAKQEPADKKLH